MAKLGVGFVCCMPLSAFVAVVPGAIEPHAVDEGRYSLERTTLSAGLWDMA